MLQSTILRVRQQRFEAYSQAFNFFQSKAINHIIAQRKIKEVVHLRDLQFYDDETEFLKRYYAAQQTISREDYYEAHMTPPSPNLLAFEHYHIFDNRNKKILKLCIQKEKSQARGSPARQDQSDPEFMILSQLDRSNLSLAESDEKEEEGEEQSYDSEPYCVFDQSSFEEKGSNFDIKQSIKNGKNKLSDSLKQSIDFRGISESDLVLDFKNEVEEPGPQINIVPPTPINLIPSPIQNNTFKEETVPNYESILAGKKVQKQRQQKVQKVEKQRTAIGSSPDFKKQVSGSAPISGLGKLLKNENIQLAQSIQIRKQQQKKPSTFMQYYNSMPVKQPSNILQKFMKRKK